MKALSSAAAGMHSGGVRWRSPCPSGLAEYNAPIEAYLSSNWACGVQHSADRSLLVHGTQGGQAGRSYIRLVGERLSLMTRAVLPYPGSLAGHRLCSEEASRI